MMGRLALTFIALLPAASAAAATCSGFPWTVTATPGGGATVYVHVCGTYTGCQPHNPTVVVRGSQIQVTLTRGQLPGCQCIAVVGDFESNVLVPSVPPGDYDVVVSDVYCEHRTEAGRTTFSALAASAIPTLDVHGLGALALVIGAAGIWRLRL